MNVFNKYTCYTKDCGRSYELYFAISVTYDIKSHSSTFKHRSALLDYHIDGLKNVQLI